MTQDATFEDGGDRPLNLGAFDADDLKVLSALAQDGVFSITDMSWSPAKRQLAFLINRLRHEDLDLATRMGRPVERVRSVLVVDNVEAVASQGVDRSDKDTVLSILSIDFEAGEDADGHVLLTLAGDGAIRARVEALEVALRDVTRPYAAPSGKAPDHKL
ncbi:DUF2948 family protein [Pseudoprimorskyibacter insulae]|uniref:DUF2948 domain-containing protein n=1 Tax=Pseudoprimorskyibacter insulae TaxID=1695997 RepID=A0A2R8AYQ9_9RHOB|nr:DUF2948 family protein [Pseudoprimorskyibacter insulae]SPF80994.1 hypothetical protein PRI8871_02808 [Pseudoprimorskyibacter insulae]